MADIVLINPRFETSFWGFEHALPLMGKRANMPVAALPLLAALTPSHHGVTIMDENVEDIDFDRCAKADIVGVTGMIVQRRRLRAILAELRKRDCYTVAGGPWASVNEKWFDNLVDVLFVGEAEETWPKFLADFEAGRPERRYEQEEKTDLTKVPPPRLDLLKMDRYAFGSVQFTRGCPFTCEFCDIIVIFGRRPRLKTTGQITTELDALVRQKLPFVFIVDDNLIGNKKAMKDILHHVIDWQKKNAYPVMFVTEASIDLADDPEMMGLMVEANIGAVFVGVESVNEEALKETKKVQNLRRSGTLVEKLKRIQDAGMEVWAGMMLGFDHDDETVFAAQARFLAEARISMAMIGMVSAIPKTPLYDRLRAAGRLDESEDQAFGTNVYPVNMSRERLSEGFVQLMADLYEPQAYFDRVDDLYKRDKIIVDRAIRTYGANHRLHRFAYDLRLWFEAFGLFSMLMTRIPDGAMRRTYWRRFWSFFRARPEACTLRVYAHKCAIHWHMHQFVRQLRNPEKAVVNTY